MVKSNTMFICQ